MSISVKSVFSSTESVKLLMWLIRVILDAYVDGDVYDLFLQSVYVATLVNIYISIQFVSTICLCGDTRVQFGAAGRLLACISSRPGQSGRSDG